MPDFTHLHVHTEYSLLDGVSRIDKLVERAKLQGMDSLALTDHGALYAAIDFYESVRSAGMKPVVGCEVYVAPGKRTDRRGKTDQGAQHLVLLAKNQTGYRNLIHLVTKAHVEGFYYRPRIDKELLAERHEGLLCLSACAIGEVPRLIQAGDLAGARTAAAWYRDLFGKDDYFIEIQRHDGLDWLEPINTELITIARELDLKIVATNDVHYVNPDDSRAQDLLLCVQTNTTVDDPKRMKMEGASYYLKSIEEMQRLFADHPEALTNTREVLDRCELTLDFGRVHLPQFEIPPGHTPESYLEMLSREGMKRRYNPITAEVSERLQYELGVVKETGFALYILIVWDIVAFAKRQGIMYAPRGSAAGALVLYCLGISDVDPIANKLTFERFLNIERKEMPDVDMDLADDRRDEMIEYVTQKYGRDRVAQIITFGTLGAKAAIRDVGRARGLPLPDVDRVAKMIPTLPIGMTIEQSIEQNPELKRLVDDDDAVRSLVEDAKSIEGIARHASTHAAGVVISREPLDEIVPLQPVNRADNGALMTQYHMNALQKIGLLKMDFLGLANLTILGKAVEIIKQFRGLPIDLLKLPLDDKKTYDSLANGETVGVFQLEGSGMTRYFKELKPTTIADIGAMIALYRPGPMVNIPHYIARKHGVEPIEYPHPLLEETLKDTFGVLTYQDDVLQILRRVGGYSLGQADIVRKAMGKKIRALMEKEQPRFFEGARKNGLSEGEAKEIWDLLEPFAGYGFNRAHAACYAQVTYQTAYLKSNYPVEYMVAVLQTAMGNSEKVVTAVAEARRLGITVLQPDVNKSDVGFTIEADHQSRAIRFGIAAIKNVGEAAAQAIVDARAERGAFASVDDFCQRVDTHHCNKRVLESLVKSGAFDTIARRSQLLAVLDKIIGFAQKNQQAVDAGQASLFELVATDAAPTSVSLPNVPDAPSKEKLAWEKDLLGIYLSEHPLQALSDHLPDDGTLTMNIGDELVGQRVTVAGMLTGVRTLFTKKRETMVSASLEDVSGTVNIVAFPRIYEKTKDIWSDDAIVIVRGKVDMRDEKPQLIVDAVEPFSAPDGAEADADTLPVELGPATRVAPIVQLADYQSGRHAAEGASGRVNGTTHAGSHRSGQGVDHSTESGARRLSVRFRRSGDDDQDLQLFRQIHVILSNSGGGGDEVEVVLVGAGRPRVELDWPELRIRGDGQIEKKLRQLVGAENVSTASDEPERAVAP